MTNFPAEFRWGVATSAYQVEGAALEGGREPSIWDTFARIPGAIEDGSTGDEACDHYHRTAQDIDLMRRLGVNAYRFSVSWPRVFPTGRGRPNEEGLRFYEQLVDDLLGAGIEPMITLYHWDLPRALQDAGGWPARDTGKFFVDYACTVARRLGDRAKLWVTHNEPWCVAMLGHLMGVHAPGEKRLESALATAHHLLLSHGWCREAMRTELAKDAQVGIVLNLTPGEPASPSEEDAEATRAFDGSFNRWYLDPLFHGVYPEDVIEDHRRALGRDPMSFVEEGDMDIIRGKDDFLGVNYYSRAVLRAETESNAPREIPPVPEEEKTDMGWEVYPEGLTDLLIRLKRDYSVPPIYITENGCAFTYPPDASGRIEDTRRIGFIESHVAAVAAAMDAGVDVRGYYHWSLLDNFEWGHGYTKRFGLVWVDYETQERRLKQSAYRYADIIASGGLENMT